MSIDSLFNAVQKACLPGVWSRGVALTRDRAVQEDRRTADEIIYRIRFENRPVTAKVSLWIDDEDWYCDCGDRNDPCMHVAAAAITLKAGGAQAEASAPPAAALGRRVAYRFFTKGSELWLERWITSGDTKERLAGTLVSYSGGIQSGRIAGPALAATREDFAVDLALGTSPAPRLEQSRIRPLLKALEDCSDVELDGAKVTASGRPVEAHAELADEGRGFRLMLRLEPEAARVFSNGAALCGATLRPYQALSLGGTETERTFAETDAARLATEILPALEARVPVRVLTKRLPRALAEKPRVVLEVDRPGSETLSVLPILVYGSPPVAELRQGAFYPLSNAVAVIRDPQTERQETRRLQDELHLQPGQRIELHGLAAVEFARKMKGWETRGQARRDFEVKGTLAPALTADTKNFGVSFRLPGGGSADAARVFRAWAGGEAHVPLLEGGWAALPRDWLARYGEKIHELLAAKDARGALPAYRLPELARLCEETGGQADESLQKLRLMLERFDGIPAVQPPGKLSSVLRPYQRRGLDWLTFLGNNGMGALLADDMGLGKTLQALCALRGRTLVIAPTSVLGSWQQQCEEFRPELKVALYHGGSRELDPGADITLTSYAILRLDRETLTSVDWKSVVLDEAQTIKNPESQAAQAVHALRAEMRIALSGTPVENRLSDLWSQFQFLNPGLLGSHEDFKDRFSSALSRGDAEAAAELRRKIRPFVLRRLKREVAPELPPRTETVLQCELGTEERELYQSILAASRDEVVRALEGGQNVFQALEVLLRLRQACCHRGLVPGQTAATSSKTDLLLEELAVSIEEGHRALVFSQWTSFLDLLEPRLRDSGISFLRLDGSTTDRQDVVNRFQAAGGPPVLLISLKAGGLGLTLTAADQVFIMDPWWNPAVEDQAADRAHRIGQTNPVIIHRIVAKDTVEERILELQRSKLRLARAVLDGASGALELTRQDLLALLQ